MLVIGSRGSQLALWQARWVQARLAELGESRRIEIIQTTGDKILDVALSKVGHQRPVHQGDRRGAAGRSHRPGGPQLEGHAHRAAGGPDAGGDPGARRSARCAGRARRWRSCRTGREVGTSSLRRGGAAAGAAAGSADREHPRQRRHAPAQARRRTIRGDRARVGRAAAAGLGRPHRGVCSTRT